MRQLVRALPFLAMLIGAPLAAADDYPVPLIDRPLSLEPGTFQVTGAFELYHDGAAMDPTPSNTEALAFAGDYGLYRNLQVGAVVDIVVSPSSQFGYALASGQYQFFKFAAIRVDVGASHVDSGDTYASFGAGLPIRLKLTDAAALFSSRPYAFAAEDDIVTARVGGGSISEFRLPVGLLYELTPRISVAGRSGFRTEGSSYFVPLGVDLTLTSSRVDFGVTFDVFGHVSPNNGIGYFDLLRFQVWAQLRI